MISSFSKSSSKRCPGKRQISRFFNHFSVRQWRASYHGMSDNQEDLKFPLTSTAAAFEAERSVFKCTLCPCTRVKRRVPNRDLDSLNFHLPWSEVARGVSFGERISLRKERSLRERYVLDAFSEKVSRCPW